MAQLLLIDKDTANDLQFDGDVVGIFSDEHQFSATELQKFRVMKISGSREEVESRLDSLKPPRKTVIRWQVDNSWHDEDDPPPNGDVSEFKEVYELGDRWFELENDFKFTLNVSSLSPEEKQVVETTDIGSVSAGLVARKLVKDLTALDGNDREVVIVPKTTKATK